MSATPTQKRQDQSRLRAGLSHAASPSLYKAEAGHIETAETQATGRRSQCKAKQATWQIRQSIFTPAARKSHLSVSTTGNYINAQTLLQPCRHFARNWSEHSSRISPLTIPHSTASTACAPLGPHTTGQHPILQSIDPACRSVQQSVWVDLGLHQPLLYLLVKLFLYLCRHRCHKPPFPVQSTPCKGCLAWFQLSTVGSLCAYLPKQDLACLGTKSQTRLLLSVSRGILLRKQCL